MTIIELIGILAVASMAAAAGFYTARLIFRRGRRAGRNKPRVTCRGVTQQVSAVGRLVALDVNAKEIATATSGPDWLPPALLTRAKVALVFHFERQYALDLNALEAEDIVRLSPGRVRLRPPPIRSRTTLVDLEPYDIQSGKLFGLLEIIPMNAARQRRLMAAARESACTLSDADEQSHIALARASAEREIRRALQSLGLAVEFDWSRSVVERSEPAAAVEPIADPEPVAPLAPQPIRLLQPVLSALAS